MDASDQGQAQFATGKFPIGLGTGTIPIVPQSS